MDYAEGRDKIVSALRAKSEKGGKTKFYFSDLVKMLELSPRDKEAKKIISQMIEEGILEYWSSGSTTMYGLSGTGKQASAENEA